MSNTYKCEYLYCTKLNISAISNTNKTSRHNQNDLLNQNKECRLTLYINTDLLINLSGVHLTYRRK